MSSAQSLREFMNERLTAAAEEIFTEFEKTIVRYEEEIVRQRKLLDISWKTQRNLLTAGLSQHYLCKKGFLAAQQLCNQELSNPNQPKPDPPYVKEEQEESKHLRVKEEQEELCTSQGEQVVLKQETNAFAVTVNYEGKDHSEPEPNRSQLFSQNFFKTKNQNQEDGWNNDSESSRNRSHIPEIIESPFDSEMGKKSVKCDFCGKAFQCRSKMKRHCRVHTGEKPHSCNICGRKFSSTSALSVHLRTHPGEKTCSSKICGTSFSEFQKLNDHMKTHTEEKLYSCKTCGKSFRHRSTLSAHIRTHTGEKSYSCETCGKGFIQKGNLTAHIRTHTGEKPYSCERCGKSFTQRSVLTVHMRTHTGEKPYSCEMCGKCFRHRSTLTLHLSTHIGSPQKSA